jgi:hypothetical protein
MKVHHIEATAAVDAAKGADEQTTVVDPVTAQRNSIVLGIKY